MDAIEIYQRNHDDAELLWTQSCRDELRTALTSLRQEILQHMTIDGSPCPSEVWSLPKKYVVRYQDYMNKFVVADIFVERFLADTSVILSNPQTFSVELLRVLTAIGDASSLSPPLSVTPPPTITTENLSKIIRAFVSLVMQNPELATRVAMSGIPNQLLRRMLDAAGEHDTQMACLSAMTQLVLHSEVAVQQVSFSCSTLLLFFSIRSLSCCRT